MRPPDTGSPSADAQDDFARARRRQVVGALARRLARVPGDVDVILPFDEVVAALGRIGERDLGRQTIALDTVLGTVDPGAGFDRWFQPTTPRVRARWERIANAMRRGEPMPPISVYRIGEVHFVRDGHHRVSVARTLGREAMEAEVTEVVTRVGVDRTVTVGDLPTKSHERLFHERVPLPDDARGRVRVRDGARYAVLAEHVEAWGLRAMQERAGYMDRATTARRWFLEEYAPVLELLREAGMGDSGEEADAYLDFAERRYRLMRTHDWSQEIVARVREGG